MLLQFHYTEWASHTSPFSNAILEFRRRVRSVVGSTLNSDRPMLVHCNDGGLINILRFLIILFNIYFERFRRKKWRLSSN